MSDLSEVLNHAHPRKPTPGISVREASKTHSLGGIDEQDVDDSYHGHLGVTRNDQKDMTRMGKIQQLRRNFRPFSALSFATILEATWEIFLVANTQGLVDGGLAGLFWSYIWSFLGMSLVMASLAEMASMSIRSIYASIDGLLLTLCRAPTSGGQYHWVSEFAPPKYQKLLSYVTGWLSTLSWQAGTASGPFLTGTIIQSLVSVANPNYVGTNWQGTLIVIGTTIIIYLLTVWGAEAMPMFQNLMLIIHCFGFIVLIIVLLVLAPRNPASVVFTQFTNGGGWNSMGLSLMIGQISALYALISSDGAAHLSEEIRDAGLTVPRAMVGGYVLNGALGFAVLLVYLFGITSIDDALNEPNGYPFLWVFGQAVSPGGVIGLTMLPLAVIFGSTISLNLTTSRQTWAFARDKGLPFSNWLSRVDPKAQVPANAIIFTCTCTGLLSLINIGSSAAFNAIISLNLVSLMLSYSLSIGCVLTRRIFHPERLPHCRWSLGRWGVAVNAGGLAYSLFAFFWTFWPNATPVDLVSFNWAVVMFVGVLVICMVDYWVRGRKVFTGPVVLVEGWRTE